LSQKLAELIGGWITCRSEPDVGSVFSLLIPEN
jgi:signal transduction histidine kinase